MNRQPPTPEAPETRFEAWSEACQAASDQLLQLLHRAEASRAQGLLQPEVQALVQRLQQQLPLTTTVPPGGSWGCD